MILDIVAQGLIWSLLSIAGQIILISVAVWAFFVYIRSGREFESRKGGRQLKAAAFYASLRRQSILLWAVSYAAAFAAALSAPYMGLVPEQYKNAATFLLGLLIGMTAAAGMEMIKLRRQEKRSLWN